MEIILVFMLLVVAAIIYFLVRGMQPGGLLSMEIDPKFKLIKEENEAAIRDKWQPDELYITQNGHMYVGIAWDRSIIITGVSKEKNTSYRFDQLMSSDLETITYTKTETSGQSSTNRGSQMIGATVGSLALGPAGLLVGGLSGSKAVSSSSQINETVQSVTLKLKFRDRENPIFDILLPTYLPASLVAQLPDYALLNRMHTLLLGVIDQQKGNLDASSGDISLKIERLWALKEAGALSDSEFSASKASLMNKPES